MVDQAENLGKQTFKGLLWLLFQSASGRLVSFATQLLLARLLVPSQFGTISLVYTVTNAATVLVNFGIDGVLLQRHKAMRLWVRSAFWSSLILGFAGLIVVAAAAPIFARLYHTPELTGLALILSLAMPLGALATVPGVILRHNLNFKFLAVYTTIENLFMQLGTIALAWAGFGAFAFALPTPTAALIKAIVYWIKAPPKSLGPLRRSQFGFLFRNGLRVFGGRLILEIIAQGDYATLGFMATRYEVGLYYFAFRLAAQPVWILAGNFTNVLFPALVQLKNDTARQLRGALRAARLLGYAIMPVGFTQAAIADPALRLFFGQKWVGSVHLVELLSVSIAFDAVPWVAGSLLNARRDYGRQLRYLALMMPCFFILVITGALFGKATGVAIGVTVYYAVIGPIYTARAFATCGGRLSDVLPLYIRPPLMAGAAALAAVGVAMLPVISASNLARLIVIGALSPAFYAGLLRLMEPDVFSELCSKFGVNRILSKLMRRSGQREIVL